MEIEKLKTKEIAQVQKAEIEKQDRVNKPKEADKPVQSQPTTAVKPQPQPVPRPVTYPPTRIARTPVATSVTQVAKVEKPKPRIDPEERWREAAALGTYGLGSTSSTLVASNQVTTRPTNPTTRQAVNPMSRMVAQLPTQPGSIPPVTSAERRIGINSRAEAKLLDDFLLAPQSVAQIELTDDLLFTDGSVALPEETILLIEFDPENPPTATTIPITKILLPVNGQYREIEATIGALLVRGKDNKPLKFKTVGGNSGVAFGLDDAIGVAGGILDVPTEVTQTARRVTRGSQSSQAQSTTTMLSKGASIEVYVYESFSLPTSY